MKGQVLQYCIFQVLHLRLHILGFPVVRRITVNYFAWFTVSILLLIVFCCLTTEVVSLVGDMHRCVGSVVDCFTGAKSGLENGPSSPSCAASAPARLCYVVGQALRECAVAASKLLLLCDLFSRHKHQLSREERHDLVKYCISR